MQKDKSNFTISSNISTVLDGLTYGESPRWHQGKLWLSNWGSQEVIAIGSSGKREVICKDPTTIPYSIDWIGTKLVIICGPERQLFMKDSSHDSLTLYADFQNYPTPFNEIVVDGKNNIYLNNIGFDLLSGENPKSGFIVLFAPDGKIVKVGEDLLFPNGMVITPDNSILIEAESYGNKLTTFDIKNDERSWISLKTENILQIFTNYYCKILLVL